MAVVQGQDLMNHQLKSGKQVKWQHHAERTNIHAHAHTAHQLTDWVGQSAVAVAGQGQSTQYNEGGIMSAASNVE